MPGGGPVMGEALVQRVAGRLDDVLRRIEIGFADLEMNDVAPLRLERARLHQHFEGRLSAEPRHPFGEAKFARCNSAHKGRACRNSSFVHLKFNPSALFAADGGRYNSEVRV